MPVRAWARPCHSPDGCSPGGIIAQASTLTDTYICTLAHSHTHTYAALSGPLMCCPWAPSSPVGEVEQQGAKERWRLEERNADQRETHLQVPSVMLWSRIKLLISLTHPLTHLVHQSPTCSSSQSPTHSFTQSVTHLLTYGFLTNSLCNSTSKQINKVISEGNSLQDKKQACAYFKCFVSSFVDVEQLAVYEHHPSASRVSALQSRLVGGCGCNALACTYTPPALLHLSTCVRWRK